LQFKCTVSGEVGWNVGGCSSHARLSARISALSLSLEGPHHPNSQSVMFLSVNIMRESHEVFVGDV